MNLTIIIITSLLELLLFSLFLGYVLHFSHNEINNSFPLVPNWKKSFFIKYLKHGILIFIILAVFKLFSYDMTYDFIHFVFFNFNFYYSLVLASMGLIFVIYSNNFKISDCFNFKEIFKLIYRRKIEFVIYFLLVIWVQLIIAFIGLYLPVILFNFVILFSALILLNFIAQIIKLDIIEKYNLNKEQLFSKKAVPYILVYLVSTFILIFVLFVYPGYLKKDEIQIIEEFYEKMSKTGLNCIQRSGHLDKNKFDEEIFKKNINRCNEASYKISIIPIPKKLPKQAKNILNNSRNNSSQSIKYIALSFEELLKTKGEYDSKNNHYENYLNYFEKSYNNFELVLSDKLILKKLYYKKGITHESR
jgi:hypothetical protein